MMHMSSSLVEHARVIEHTGLPTCWVALIEEIVVDGNTTTTCIMEQQKIEQFQYGQNNYKSFNYLLQSLQDNNLENIKASKTSMISIYHSIIYMT